MPPSRPRESINGHRREIDSLFEHWRYVMGKSSSRMDDRREQAIARALNIGYSAEQVRLAIEGCRASDFHMGRNDRGMVYNDVTLICRDAEHLDRFIELGERARRLAERRRENRAPANDIQVASPTPFPSELRAAGWGKKR